MASGGGVTERPDYGLDAPKVVRNLLLAGALGLMVWGGADFRSGPASWCWARLPESSCSSGCGRSLARRGLHRDGALDALVEQDRQAPRPREASRPASVDRRRTRARRGLRPRTDAGGRRETADDRQGYRDRHLAGGGPLGKPPRRGPGERAARRRERSGRPRTADMRKIPFPDGAFDVVVSSQAIHNIYSADGRAQAVARDRAGSGARRTRLPPGHPPPPRLRRGSGLPRRRGRPLLDSRFVTVFLAIVTFGSLRPGTLLGRKSA